MRKANLFPLGIAENEMFCNRVDEQVRLKNNIESVRHTILLAPRRYGKTSLALKVLNKNKFLYAKTDFLLASSEHSVETIILHAVGKLIGQLLPFHKKTIEKVRQFMDSLSPRIIVGAEGPHVEFTPRNKPKQNIVETLEGLDRLAGDQGKSVVILFDEFQQIATLKNNEALEAAIRHAAERSKHVSYIFSGSNRHLLAAMFQDSTRPLYHLCDQINLPRINKKHYYSYFEKAAKSKWKSALSISVMDVILNLTACHSYYVNMLCSRLWAMDILPTEKTVASEWHLYAFEQRSRVITELATLSPNQRAVVAQLAREPAEQPTGQAFLNEVELSSASVVQAIKQLQEKDIIYRDESGLLKLLDPVVEYLINQKN